MIVLELLQIRMLFVFGFVGTHINNGLAIFMWEMRT